jgi:hypothetical protein
VSRFDEALPAFDGEHDMNINLGAGIGHEPKMPLLTELENLIWLFLQRGRADGAAHGNRKIFFVR